MLWWLNHRHKRLPPALTSKQTKLSSSAAPFFFFLQSKYNFELNLIGIVNGQNQSGLSVSSHFTTGRLIEMCSVS